MDILYRSSSSSSSNRRRSILGIYQLCWIILLLQGTYVLNLFIGKCKSRNCLPQYPMVHLGWLLLWENRTRTMIILCIIYCGSSSSLFILYLRGVIIIIILTTSIESDKSKDKYCCIHLWGLYYPHSIHHYSLYSIHYYHSYVWFKRFWMM